MHSLDPHASDGPGRPLSSPSARRNRDPILAVLRRWLPERGRVLEIASGSGEHAVHFARALPGLEWQPSDPNVEARASIEAWRHAEALGNLAAPLELDVMQRPWPVDGFDAVVCINMLHISPWPASEALLAEAGARLPSGAILYLYGPFRRDGEHTAQSNADFDADLRLRDSRWGIRDLEAVIEAAEAQGLAVEEVVEMPANNLSVVLRRD
ncbi:MULTISPECIES: DUF938 domain-containing protein [Halomonadaceae]|uniref:DUF938 domain-containing protein n=1 Tax=Halomonadaceae TaxID=28256 RepID=UPI0015995CED|nr:MULTISPECIES: DUF938 domain-containing protein [Halomonas]QJQ94866.1 DUF938 domain-containing protein [Halomonas sp. PA5]